MRGKQIRRRPTALERRLAEAGVTKRDVARLAAVSWQMVYYVCRGDRTSANVLRAIEKLTGPIREAADWG